jgi:FkbM family methyltransferase
LLNIKEVYRLKQYLPVYKQLELTSQRVRNINCYNLAVSDFEGKSEFYVDDKRLSNSSFQNLVNGQKIEVDTIKLDNNFKLDNIGFMKIDVEGVELDVLNGASNLIKEYKPTCMVEIYEKFNKYPVETTFDYFFSRGYKCFYNHRAQGLKQVNNIQEGKEAQKIPEITDGDFLFTI